MEKKIFMLVELKIILFQIVFWLKLSERGQQPRTWEDNPW